MKIESITVSKLQDLINDNAFWRQSILPITKQRALSFVHNPRTQDDNVVLFCGYSKNRLIGYLCILPDYIYIDGNQQRIGLLSSWWVDPENRKSGVGAFLLVKALKAYQQKIVGIKYNKKSGAVILRSNKFVELENNSILVADVWLRTKSLGPKKMHEYRSFRVATKPFIYMINMYNKAKSVRFAKSIRDRIVRFEYCNRVDNETDEFIKKKQDNSLFRRAASELNWILQYPWVLHSPDITMIKKNYFFSSNAKRFFNLVIKVKDNKNIVGFVMIKIRDEVLDVPYVYYEPPYIDGIMHIIIRHAIQLDIGVIRIYDMNIHDSMVKCHFPFIKTEIYKNGIALSNSLNIVDDKVYALQGGDGDCVFT